MGDNILFSVVIPTLNSESVLRDTLASLLPQVINLKTVEIIIINNGSTDNTQAIIDEYNYLFPIVKSVKRNKTIPARENFKDGVHQAVGEYVLLLGDDDILFPSFFNEIMPLLEKEYGLIHYNRVKGDNNLKENKQIFRSINAEGCIIYKDYFDFVNDYCIEFNFMSSVIFRKDVWMKGENIVSYDKPYYGYFWYATLVFGAVGYKCLYYPYPLVIQRIREQTWKAEWPLYWIVGMFSIYKDLDRFVPGIFSSFYEQQHNKRKNHFISLFDEIARAKCFYKSYKKDFCKILNKKEMVLFNIVLNTPYLIGRFCQKLYRIIGF